MGGQNEFNRSASLSKDAVAFQLFDDNVCIDGLIQQFAAFRKR